LSVNSDAWRGRTRAGRSVPMPFCVLQAKGAAIMRAAPKQCMRTCVQACADVPRRAGLCGTGSVVVGPGA